jgi:hypothetical protein
MNDIAEKSNTDIMHRFHSLSPGEYWLCLADHETAPISEGQVLLIEKIDYADGSPHTIHVRLHPSIIENSRGQNQKYLTDDFVAAFEYVPVDEAEACRKQETENVTNRLAATQEELKDACTDTALLDKLIAAADENDSGVKNQLPVKRDALPASVVNAIESQEVCTLMSPGLSVAGVEKIKSIMLTEKNIVEKRSVWIGKKTTELSSIAAELTPYFQEKAAVALSSTQDIRDHIDELMKGIGSLNIYTGKDVGVRRLSEGVSASKGEQLTVMQSVLFMDEELAVWSEVEDDFDHLNQEQFFELLPTTEGLINQIFPSLRCVVAMSTTRRELNYIERGYGGISASMNESENRKVFLLVRDGDNLFSVCSPEIRHQYTPRLFPSMDEFNNIFTGVRGEAITYKDLDYTNKLGEHESMTLSYKRLLILLCGLDHRENLFGCFYEGDPSLDFVSLDFQEKHFRFIHDDDGSGLLPREEIRPLEEWVTEMNSAISGGSRVLFDWSKLITSENSPACFERENRWNTTNYSSRSMLYTPQNSNEGFAHEVVRKKKDRPVLSVDVQGESSTTFMNREFSASIDLLASDYDWDSNGYLLCLDRVSPEELTFYLHHRPSRAKDVTRIRLLKRALDMVKRDLIEEAPVREKLAMALVEGDICHADSTKTFVDEAVTKWRNTNNGRSLSEATNNPRLYKALLDQLFLLVKGGPRDVSRLLEHEGSLNLKTLRITITASGEWCTYSETPPTRRDDRLEYHCWVTRTRYKSTKKGFSSQPATQVLLPKIMSKESVKWESEIIGQYIQDKTPLLATPKSKKDFLAPIDCFQSLWDQLQQAKIDSDVWMTLANQWHKQSLSMSNAKYVETAVIALPLGVYKAQRHSGNGYGYYALATHNSAEYLASIAPSKGCLQWLMTHFVSRFECPSHTETKLKEAFNDKSMELTLSRIYALKLPTSLCQNTSRLQLEILKSKDGRDYSFQAKLEADNAIASYISPLIGNDLDTFLGVTPPEKYRPLMSCRNNFHGKNRNEIDVYEYTEETLHNRYGREYSEIECFDTLEDLQSFYVVEGLIYQPVSDQNTPNLVGRYIKGQ